MGHFFPYYVFPNCINTDKRKKTIGSTQLSQFNNKRRQIELNSWSRRETHIFLKFNFHNYKSRLLKTRNQKCPYDLF